MSNNVTDHRVSYSWDKDSDALKWTEGAEKALELPLSRLPKSRKDLSKLINPQDLPAYLRALHTYTQENGRVELSYRLRLGSGHHVEVKEVLECSKAKKGGAWKGVLSFDAPQDITCNVEMATNLEIQEFSKNAAPYSRQDMVHYLQYIQQRNEGKIYGGGYFLAIGVDHVSLFNDAFGMSGTDEVLEEICARLQDMFAGRARVARINGDVFGLFMEQGARHDMSVVAGQIIAAFRSMPLITKAGPVRAGLSVGGACVEGSLVDISDVIARAEFALRHAKERGRGCFVAYDDKHGYGNDAQKLLHSGEEFLQALNENRIQLAYQPIMNSKSQKASFHECLIRMIARDGSMVNAAHFVPAVESLGMVRLLDQCALRLAVDELTRFPDAKLSVNVSKWSLLDKDWLRSAVLALRDRPHAAKRMVVEITESVAMMDMKQTSTFVKTLKDLGCRVALDDFGTGYTGFNQILDLDIDIIKIDKAFVRGMSEGKNQVFIKALQMLADGVDVETVGEGAETAEEAAWLSNDGVQHIQGYFYGMPSMDRLWLPENHVHRTPVFKTQTATPDAFKNTARSQ